MITILDEATTSALIDHALAFDAVRAALIAVADGSVPRVPVTTGSGAGEGQRYTVKSGRIGGLVGLKVGAYWPGNEDRGMPRHSSTILLLDERTGRPRAVIEASRVNGFRTAAADALAVDALARADAATLAVFGAGHQAAFEVAAVLRLRPFRRVLIVNRDRARAEALAASFARDGLAVQVAGAQEAVAEADVIVTATNATAPLFQAEWVRPGTHISAMGADGRGKQELPPALLRGSLLFCDLPEQSVEVGEFQWVHEAVRDGTVALTAVGAVLSGRAAGRRTDDDITVFDSSGIAAQDLAVAEALLARYIAGSPP